MAENADEVFGEMNPGVACMFARRLGDEVVEQVGKIVNAVVQGGNFQGNDIEPVVEVFAEISASNCLGEIPVGGGHDSDIDLDTALGVAHAMEFAVLQYSQKFRLKGSGDFADFVEEKGPAVRGLEEAVAITRGASERALGVSEEFALEKALGKGRTINFDKGAF